MAKTKTRRFPSSEPQSFELSVRGETAKTYFRRISAGQRESMLLGQVVEGRVGESATFKVDLGKEERTKMMLVQFSVCESDGAPMFEDLDAVRGEDPAWVAALYEKAKEVNAEEDTGKS